MQSRITNGVVLYIRVSTDEQAQDPLNLEKQQQSCLDYCGRQHLNVVRIFIDPGESARTSDRPQFQAMLRYCAVKSNHVSFVVVQDLSRFARNQFDQGDAIRRLRDCGVVLRSTFEYFRRVQPRSL
jgi:site-specific DNA recombinase